MWEEELRATPTGTFLVSSASEDELMLWVSLTESGLTH